MYNPRIHVFIIYYCILSLFDITIHYRLIFTVHRYFGSGAVYMFEIVLQ